jgi:hypothetical protein
VDADPSVGDTPDLADAEQARRPSVTYAERLRAPVWIWCVTAILAATFGFAFGVYFGSLIGAVLAVLTETLIAGLLVAGAARVAVDDGAIVAGRARLPCTFVAEVTPLNRAGAAYLRGRGADPRAFMLLRPWIDQAVRVDLDDPRDPHPYWYVSTRRPLKLTAAIDAAMLGRAPSSTNRSSPEPGKIHPTASGATGPGAPTVERERDGEA